VTDLGFWSRFIAKRTKKNVERNAAVALATDIVSPHATADDVRNYLANRKDHRHTREAIAAQVRKQFASAEGACAPIHFIGVWDTVESVGIVGLQRKITSNGTTKDEQRFRHIRHALSMDEHRRTFAPRLYWDDDYDVNADDPAQHRSLRQRWFRGVHSDVGGGYDVREAGLSDQAYRWMLNEAIACGLTVAPQLVASASRPKPLIAHDPCYDTPWWGVAGLTVRSNVTHLEKGREKIVRVTTEGAASDPNPRIHSVWLAVLRVASLRTVIVLLSIAALFCGYGWQAAAAMGDIAPADSMASIVQGAMALELWQKTYFMSGLDAWRSVGVNLQHVQPAVMAMLVDFGLIVAYSWLIGLYGTLAFHAMVGRRNPGAAPPFFYRWGNAPMYLVVADVAENVATLLVLWCIAHDLTRLSYGVGAAMMVASMIKWASFLDTVLLLCGGLAATLRTAPPAVQVERERVA